MCHYKKNRLSRAPSARKYKTKCSENRDIPSTFLAQSVLAFRFIGIFMRAISVLAHFEHQFVLENFRAHIKCSVFSEHFGTMIVPSTLGQWNSSKHISWCSAFMLLKILYSIFFILLLINYIFYCIFLN